MVLILGAMGSRLIHSGPTLTRAWVPTRPLSVGVALDYLRCDEAGVSKFDLEVAGCLDSPPLDFVSPLRNRLARDGFSVLPFPYDWRQSLLVTAAKFATWVEEQSLETFDIVGISIGGLIATQYVRMGFGARIRKFISIGTPFLGMPRALASLHTGAVLNRVADWFLGRKLRTLMRTFPSAYEVLPTAAYFDSVDQHYIEAGKRPLTSHTETLSYLEAHGDLSSPLLREGTKFLLQLAPAETLRAVDTSFIIGTGVPTPVRIQYRTSGRIRVSRQPLGDGSAPASSQTIGGQLEHLDSGRFHEFRGRHRTMHLNPRIMTQIAEILLR